MIIEIALFDEGDLTAVTAPLAKILRYVFAGTVGTFGLTGTHLLSDKPFKVISLSQNY